jgi:hypothetical protein
MKSRFAEAGLSVQVVPAPKTRALETLLRHHQRRVSETGKRSGGELAITSGDWWSPASFEEVLRTHAGRRGVLIIPAGSPANLAAARLRLGAETPELILLNTAPSFNPAALFGRSRLDAVTRWRTGIKKLTPPEGRLTEEQQAALFESHFEWIVATDRSGGGR